jgi:TonB-dependent SusC/RagA subfamily outer membrane receptor
VTDATVFLQGAELTATARLDLQRGVNEVTIEGLSPWLDSNSLKIGFDGGVVVSAFEFSIDYLAAARGPSARLRMLRDSMEVYSSQLARIDVDIKINGEMQKYLETGIAKNVSGSEAGLGIEELKKTMDYYKSKSEEILGGERDLRKRRAEVQAALNRVQNQYNEESGADGRNTGVLKLNLTSPAAGTHNATISYFTPAASWSPYYDVNAASTDKPVTIMAKSKVRQWTGLDWEGVRLKLSTATPSNGRVAPLFSTWFLHAMNLEDAVVTTRGSQLKMARTGSVAAAQNAYSYDMAEESTRYVDEGINIRGTGGATSQPALVIVDGREVDHEYLQNLDPSMIDKFEVLKDAAATSIYGSRAADGVILVTLKKSMAGYVTATTGALDVTYDIDLPYTIPGNSKDQVIDLATKQATPEYKYYCAPRLDGATYLIAEFSNWQELGLLSAPAGVTFDGTYIGETLIDAGSAQEKLTLTLGTDKRVVVTRELVREFSATRAIGSNTERTFTWRITVRNNRTEAIRMVLKDQYPTSTDRSVTVAPDTKTTTPWTANREDTGVVTWEGTLTPGEVRVYTFSYTVRHPKEMVLDI